MKRVILESPYAANAETGVSIEDHVRYARMCVRDCLRRGETAIASHLLYTQDGVLDDLIPSERELGIKAGLLWREVADYSVYYTDFGWSRGMLAALESAKSEGKPYEIRSLLELPNAKEVHSECFTNDCERSPIIPESPFTED